MLGKKSHAQLLNQQLLVSLISKLDSEALIIFAVLIAQLQLSSEIIILDVSKSIWKIQSFVTHQLSANTSSWSSKINRKYFPL